MKPLLKNPGEFLQAWPDQCIPGVILQTILCLDKIRFMSPFLLFKLRV